MSEIRKERRREKDRNKQRESEKIRVGNSMIRNKKPPSKKYIFTTKL